MIGAVVAESREIHRIETLTGPIRDMFSAIFFVAIGLMIDPKLILQHWVPVTIITVAVVAGKSLSCSFGSFVAGNDTRTVLLCVSPLACVTVEVIAGGVEGVAGSIFTSSFGA